LIDRLAQTLLSEDRLDIRDGVRALIVYPLNALANDQLFPAAKFSEGVKHSRAHPENGRWRSA
jgi:ATP-dependent helicase YprA (DUF1998 family)